jgi:1,6-anhydro-N-acetylmuramate kinase
MKMKRRSREISIAAMKIKCVSLLSSPSRDRVLAVSFAIAHVAREQLGNDTSTDIRNDIRRLIWRVNQARNVILDKFVLHSRVIVLLPQ